MAKKNDFVTVHCIVLKNEERAAAVPDDTHKVPLEMWVKGHLLFDANLNEPATVVTRTGRTVKGTLCDETPHYTHSFGSLIPELMEIDDMVKGIVFGGRK